MLMLARLGRWGLLPDRDPGPGRAARNRFAARVEDPFVEDQLVVRYGPGPTVADVRSALQHFFGAHADEIWH
jgi:hypothetical protein